MNITGLRREKRLETAQKKPKSAVINRVPVLWLIKNSEMRVEMLKTDLYSNLSVNEFY